MTYVLDTSVVLADPRSLTRFEENHVVLPLVVLTELENKRHHPELGWAARNALRLLEDLRTANGSLTAPMVANDDGGTLRVELNHTDSDAIPAAIRDGTNDYRILSVAKNLADDGEPVVLVTKDLPLRLKASVVGVTAEEYRFELATRDEWSGFVDLQSDASTLDELYDEGSIDLDEAVDLPTNTGVALVAGGQSALARVKDDKRLHLIDGNRSLFGIRGRSAEQRIAIEMLNDQSIPVISLGGHAGTGKSVLALATALEMALERKLHEHILVFRPVIAVGGQELGYLPGSEEEKMSPWAAAVTDALGAVARPEVAEEVKRRGLLEVLPLTHIRGRSLNNAFVIIDEAQNLERNVLLTALSRIGIDSRVVLTHDVAQRDNLRVGRHDGVVSVIDELAGHPLFAHVTLRRSERSEVASMAAALLD